MVKKDLEKIEHYNAVLLEEMNSKLKFVVEYVQSTDERYQKKIDEFRQKHDQDIEDIKLILKMHEKRFDSIEFTLDLHGKLLIQNEKRWDENNRRWDENQKQWTENQQRWDLNQERWEGNNLQLQGMHQLLNILVNEVKDIKLHLINRDNYFQTEISTIKTHLNL
ncbi:hypothetical protein K1X76_03755 [bacterium]|nr:hypothetical protein [bacterium]